MKEVRGVGWERQGGVFYDKFAVISKTLVSLKFRFSSGYIKFRLSSGYIKFRKQN